MVRHQEDHAPQRGIIGGSTPHQAWLVAPSRAHRLDRLDLVSGTIPQDFDRLKDLEELHLEKSGVRGSLAHANTRAQRGQAVRAGLGRARAGACTPGNALLRTD